MHNTRASQYVYDSTTPDLIPEHSLAFVYVNTDGTHAWTDAQVDRMSGVRGISESSNPEFARYASIIAIEPGAANPPDAVPFIAFRRHLGHDDALCYVNLSNWDATEEECISHNYHPGFIVAHPGGTTDVRSARGTRPVGVQNYWGTDWDRTVLLQPIPFTSPADFTATGG